jgi:hypothetical protein
VGEAHSRTGILCDEREGLVLDRPEVGVDLRLVDAAKPGFHVVVLGETTTADQLSHF